MGSSEWEELLVRQLALLPGSKDPGGGPVLVVPLPSDPGLHDLGGISATLKYLKTIPSASCRDRGWVVIVDARTCPYRLVKPTVSTIRAALGNIRYLFVVRPEGFWEKQRVDCRKSEVDNQPLFVSVSKLLRHLELHQLPENFGGTLKYDHNSWIRTRKLYEEFIDECERVKRDLESLQAELRREEPCSRASTLQDLLSVNTSTYNCITAKPVAVFKMGEEVLQILEMDEESGFRMKESIGFTDEACRRARNLLQEVHLLLTGVQASWRRLQSALDMYHEVQVLENEMNEIGKWLVSAGQTLLSESRIGTTIAEAESLLREHEAIELKCRETYARWARLRYRVEEALERGEGDLRSLADHASSTADLRSLKEYTDTLVRSFATRLDRRRTLILASVRFHRIAKQLDQRCGVLLQEGRWQPLAHDLDLLQKTIRELTARREAVDYLGNEGNKAGEKLLDLLTVGVKDLSGRDITPDYTEELNHIHLLLKSANELYERTTRQTDVARLRLKQAGQLLTCHQDLKQAQQWLQALLEALISSNSQVGRSVEEMRCLKTDHQQFQETAAGTFEYGYECARAALLVEKSGGSPTPSDSQKLIAKLEDTWKMFVQGSQEQLTRLRVAGIFFRTMEQHLSRLDNLTEAIKNRSLNTKRRLPSDEEGRSLLSARDRLLREIGRNVRLGKLLKERLKDPLVPYYKNSNFNENILTQEAISERISFITNRARHLDSILLPSTHISPTPHSTSPPPMSTSPPSPSPPPPPPPPEVSEEAQVSTKVGSSPVLPEEYEDVVSDYWSCSDCSSSGTYHTCRDCLDLESLFSYVDELSLLDDESLLLDDILCIRSTARSKLRSRSLSPTRARRSRSRSRSISLPRYDGDRKRRKSSPTHPQKSVSTASLDSAGETSLREKKKKAAPDIHPDGEARRKKSPSRASSLTKEIVASFRQFRDKVLERSRSRSRSESGDRDAHEFSVDRIRAYNYEDENAHINPEKSEFVEQDSQSSGIESGTTKDECEGSEVDLLRTVPGNIVLEKQIEEYSSYLQKNVNIPTEALAEYEEEVFENTPPQEKLSSLGKPSLQQESVEANEKTKASIAGTVSDSADQPSEVCSDEKTASESAVLEETGATEHTKPAFDEANVSTQVQQWSDKQIVSEYLDIPVTIQRHEETDDMEYRQPETEKTERQETSEKTTTRLILQTDSEGDQQTLTLERVRSIRHPETGGASLDQKQGQSWTSISLPSSQQASFSACTASPFIVCTTACTITCTTSSTATNSSATSTATATTSNSYVGSATSPQLRSLSRTTELTAAKATAANVIQAVINSAVITASELLSKHSVSETSQILPQQLKAEEKNNFSSVTEVDAAKKSLRDAKFPVSDKMPNSTNDSSCINVNAPTQSVHDRREEYVIVVAEMKADNGEHEVQTVSASGSNLINTETDKIKLVNTLSYVPDEYNENIPPRPPLPAGALTCLATIYAQMASGQTPCNLQLLSSADSVQEARSPLPPRPQQLIPDSDSEEEDSPPPVSFPTTQSFVRLSSPTESPSLHAVRCSEVDQLKQSNFSDLSNQPEFPKRTLHTILELSSSSPDSQTSEEFSGQPSPTVKNELSSQIMQFFASAHNQSLNTENAPEVVDNLNYICSSISEVTQSNPTSSRYKHSLQETDSPEKEFTNKFTASIVDRLSSDTMKPGISEASAADRETELISTKDATEQTEDAFDDIPPILNLLKESADEVN